MCEFINFCRSWRRTCSENLSRVWSSGLGASYALKGRMLSPGLKRDCVARTIGVYLVSYAEGC